MKVVCLLIACFCALPLFAQTVITTSVAGESTAQSLTKSTAEQEARDAALQNFGRQCAEFQCGRCERISPIVISESFEATSNTYWHALAQFNVVLGQCNFDHNP